jgi:broad specificity phosphatase PhoE
MNIYLIRHGQKQDDSKNFSTMELTEKGFKQANLLGKRLKKYNIERIYSSDMVRAIQTSEEINKYLKVDIIVDHELREIDMGEYTGRGLKYVEENYPDFIKEFSNHTSDVSYPNGECGGDVWERSKKTIKEIINSGLENVAVVAHGGMIRVLISGFLGLHQERRFFFGSPLENCSITLVKYDNKNKNFYIQYFNDYSHLEDLED